MAEQKGQPARLEDVLNYQPESSYTADDIAWIQNTFRDKRAFSVLRKTLLPTVADPELPIEEWANDPWMTGVDFNGMQNDEVKPIVLGRQYALKLIMGALIKLRILANAPKDKSRADSTK